MRILYYSLLLIAAATLVYIGFLADMSFSEKELIFIILLGFFLFVYEPIIDYIFIKKMNLYNGEHLWKKYPFWKYRKMLLFGKRNSSE